MSLETERAVSRISWCPTRPGLLASLARDSAAVVLHDIMSWAVGHEDGESSVQVQQSVLNIFLSMYIYFYFTPLARTAWWSRRLISEGTWRPSRGIHVTRTRCSWRETTAGGSQSAQPIRAQCLTYLTNHSSF